MKAVTFTRRSPTVLCFVAFGFIVAGCHEKKSAEETPAVRVENSHVLVTPGSAPEGSISVETSRPPAVVTLALNGRIVWDENVTTRVFTPLAGRVSRISVENGQAIQSGATLALIASPDYGQAAADAHKAESDFILKERTLNRVKELHDNGAAALKDFQAAQADFEQAQSERQRSRARLALYGDGDAAGQDYALKSQIGGTVVEKNISPGQEVRSDQMLANVPQLAAPLFVVTDPARLWVQIDAPERDAGLMRVGQTFTVQSASLPGQTFTGRVEVVSDALDPNTRTLKVRGSLDNPDRRLKGEMFVKAEFTLAAGRGAEVSARAVILRGEKHCVLVEETPGHYARRVVSVGAEHAGRLVITEGLEVGQRVVVDGMLLLEAMLNEEVKS